MLHKSSGGQKVQCLHSKVTNPMPLSWPDHCNISHVLNLNNNKETGFIFCFVTLPSMASFLPSPGYQPLLSTLGISFYIHLNHLNVTRSVAHLSTTMIPRKLLFIIDIVSMNRKNDYNLENFLQCSYRNLPFVLRHIWTFMNLSFKHLVLTLS